MSYHHLCERTLIELTSPTIDTDTDTGAGANNPITFLQDILTADIASLAIGQMRQSCLLSPQGRILIEMMVYITGDNSLLIGCDTSQHEELIKKLTLYRLRRKITITARPDLAIIAAFDDSLTPPLPSLADALLTCQDERAPMMGKQSIITKDALATLPLSDAGHYHARRIANAITHGPQDLTPNRALMLEAGLDLFEAVDFKKGCYIGQEVTARTRYRGLVKRRMVPVIGTNLAPSDSLFLAGKEVGTIFSTAPYADEANTDSQIIALASLRLSAIHEAEAGAALTSDEQGEGAKVTIQIPDHIRPIPVPDSKS